MSALNALKFSAKYRPYKSFTSLKMGKYIINKFSSAETEHGERIRIDLDKFYMYLPGRFSGFSSDQLSELNKTQKLMIYKGRDKKNHDRLIIEFEEVKKGKEKKVSKKEVTYVQTNV